MSDSMVTGRMPADKKEAGNAILKRAGLNPSQAINLLYSRIIEEQSAAFLVESSETPSAVAWEAAASFVDSLSQPRASRFDAMTKAQIKRERLAAKGLMS